MHKDDIHSLLRQAHAQELGEVRQQKMTLAEFDEKTNQAEDNNTKLESELAKQHERLSGWLGEVGLPPGISPSAFANWVEKLESARVANSKYTIEKKQSTETLEATKSAKNELEAALGKGFASLDALVLPSFHPNWRAALVYSRRSFH